MRKTRRQPATVPLDAPEAEWSKALERERALKTLPPGPVGRAEIARLEQTLQLSRTQIYRLVRAFRATPLPRSLLLKPPGPRAGARRLPAEVEQVIAEHLRSRYFQRERPSVAAVHGEIIRDCARQQLARPSLTAVRARIAAWPERAAVVAREGGKAARARYDPVQPGCQPALPLDRVQIDHTQVDVHLVDSVHRLPIGRPWLTVLLDVATRMVLGMHLTLEAPSSAGVALALAHAVAPKQAWLEARDLDLPWPASGLPKTLHLDNAAEFHALALRRGCQQYGIEIQYRPPGRPHFGGHIERLMGTLMRRLQALPGTSFSNVAARGDYPSETRAALSLEELERIIALEILGPYHHERHGGLGEPPIAAWSRGILQRAPSYPVDCQAFRFDFLPCAERIVRRDGIKLFGITYFDRTLAHLVSRIPVKRLIRYDPDDLSAIYVLMPNQEYQRVPYAQLGHPPVSLWEYQAARKVLRQRGRHAVNEQAAFLAIDEQRRVVNAATVSNELKN